METYKELAKQAKDKAVAQVGSHAKLAEALSTQYQINITRQGISFWSRVPVKYLAQVSQISGVPVRELVPEIALDQQLTA